MWPPTKIRLLKAEMRLLPAVLALSDMRPLTALIKLLSADVGCRSK
jgi:hypothetical protein